MRVVESIYDYLRRLQQFELEPGMINLQVTTRDAARSGGDQPSLTANVDRVNRVLNQHLVACQDCFHPLNRCAVQVWAAPIHPDWRVDAFCNIRVDPTTIIVDVGRVAAPDWLKLVAHEYAHAIVGGAGHSPRYGAMLQHLCLGLGFEWMADPDWSEADLQVFPAYQSTIDPLRFWREGA
jgi:hypothetical protein